MTAENDGQHCPRCGRRLSPSDPQGLCPQCLVANPLLHTTTHEGRSEGDSALISDLTQDLSIDARGRVQVIPPLAAGERVGEFEIVRRLGRGGMGTVYEATDLSLDRRVALKVLSRAMDDDQAKARFLREGRLAASINHPHSVFVFGTHDVDGAPLISMELITGGTLEQRVRKSGPLPHREAVDAILQIIDGLAAAYAVGVLHRDVKPSNCFVDAQGGLKIGDYGLSISTDPQLDVTITQAGSFLGTPAFSSPEQLRGEALDVRSDIYSVGVTLFYLLTGDTPFRSANFPQFLAAVLEREPPSPSVLNPSVPQELSAIVLRLMAKQSGDRFADYEALRRELEPWSSAAPDAAPLGRRTLAGMMDTSLCAIPGMVTAAFTRASIWQLMAFMGGALLYYTVCEHRWGCTLGKYILGLRVMDEERQRPRWTQALVRAGFFLGFPSLVNVPFHIAFRNVDPAAAATNPLYMLCLMGAGLSTYVLLAVMYSTARRRNGFASLYDLLTGTRVIMRRRNVRGPLSQPSPPAVAEEETNQMLGPYHVLAPLGEAGGVHTLLGYDTLLLRRVWLHAGASRNDLALPPYAATLGRPARMRWLNEGQDDHRYWQAYAAPTGIAWRDVMAAGVSWEEGKHWLADLAGELETAVDDDTLPPTLGTGQLWITEEGRLMLLETTAPVSTTPEEAEELGRPWVDPRAAANELLQQAVRELAAALPPMGKEPIPLSAFQLLTSIPEGQSLSANVEALQSAAQHQVIRTPQRRAMMALATYALPVMTLVLSCVYAVQTVVLFSRNADLRRLYAANIMISQLDVKTGPWYPLAPGSEEVMAEVAAREDQAELVPAVRTVVAGPLRHVIEDQSVWQSLPAIMYFHPAVRLRMQSLAAGPAPSSAEVQAAETLLAPMLSQLANRTRAVAAVQMRSMAFLPSVAWLFYVGMPALLAGLCFRGGLVLHGFQNQVVHVSGRTVSRLRIAARAFLPILPGMGLFLASSQDLHRALGFSVSPWLVATLLLGCATLVVVSNFFGPRSLADRLVGTVVVPK